MSFTLRVVIGLVVGLAIGIGVAAAGPGVWQRFPGLVEPLAVAVHVVRTSGFRPGDLAVVMGGGPIGNLIAQVLRASGARAVVVAEVKDFRRELAERQGIATFNPAQETARDALRRLTGESSADRVFEATGSAAAVREAIDVCRIRGEITWVGLPKTPPEVNILQLVLKEIRDADTHI